MSRRRKRSRRQGIYFIYCPSRKKWVCSVSDNTPPGFRYSRDFSRAMHFRNFTRANRFRKPGAGEEIRKLVWKWWVFSITKRVEGSND